MQFNALSNIGKRVIAKHAIHFFFSLRVIEKRQKLKKKLYCKFEHKIQCALTGYDKKKYFLIKLIKHYIVHMWHALSKKIEFSKNTLRTNFWDQIMFKIKKIAKHFEEIAKLLLGLSTLKYQFSSILKKCIKRVNNSLEYYKWHNIVSKRENCKLSSRISKNNYFLNIANASKLLKNNKKKNIFHTILYATNFNFCI